MKKILLLTLVLACALSVTSLSFAAGEFEMKAVVTKIDGSQVTIKDVKGRETAVESKGNGIKVGDMVLLKGQMIKSGSATGLTTQDIDFLTKQCLIDQADVNVIPKLKEETRNYLYFVIAHRDCKLLEPFKVTREFLKKFTPPPDKSPFPPKGFKNDFLTSEESKYINDVNKRILDKAFEDFGRKR